MPKAKITALGCYVPPRVLSNHDLEKMVETNEAKKLVRHLPSLEHVAEWVEQARKLTRVVTY